MPEPLTIRRLTAEDCPALAAAFEAQGWPQRLEQLRCYVLEERQGKIDTLLALWEGEPAGYTTIRWEGWYPPFREAGIPEINDLNVLEKFQRRGIATALMEEAERRVARVSPVIGLGVGLTADYGKAQRLYVRRGYLPDGRGLSYNGRLLQWGDQTRVDDNLILCLTRRLRPDAPERA